MNRPWVHATGYLAFFRMPLLFLAGTATGNTWLAFGVVVLIFPLARLGCGALPGSGATEWSEGMATWLDSLPLVYVPVLAGCILLGVASAALAVPADLPAAVGLGLGLGLGLSLWMTLLFATCVAHELIHRRNGRQAILGYVLAGICGYPALGMEHLAHHARPGETTRAECPTRTESVWTFPGRRLRRIATAMFGPNAPIWQPQLRMLSLHRTRVAMGATALTWIAFVALAGWFGAVLYLAMTIGAAFGVQLITYIQHWGLGDDSIPDRVAYGRGREEDCRFQAWITLNISLHDGHHRDSRRPYYRLELTPDSPRLPASYVLLMSDRRRRALGDGVRGITCKSASGGSSPSAWEFGRLLSTLNRLRGPEFVAPKRSVEPVRGPPKVAPQRKAHIGRRHSGRLRGGPQLETVRAHHFGSLACKQSAGIPSGRRMAPRFTTSVTARSKPRCTAWCSSTRPGSSPTPQPAPAPNCPVSSRTSSTHSCSLASSLTAS